MLNQLDAIRILSAKAQAEGACIVSEIASQTVWLHTAGDRPSHLYLSGPMGMAPSVALGVAAARPGLPVLALCGDGATAMNFSALVTISHHAPKNLTLAVMDNGIYDFTGKLPSPSRAIDWEKLTRSLTGFTRFLTLEDIGSFSLSAKTGPALIHCPVGPMQEKASPFPFSGPEIHKRFRRFCDEL